MRIFQTILGLMIGVFLWIVAPALPAHAASSAAIRAYDDVQAGSRNFVGKDLEKAEFSNARLVEADFSGANLRGAVFNGSVLTDANLRGADFSDGIAYLSNLSGANLSNAIFTSAMLLKSNFRGATVTGADFSYAMLDREQISQLCQTASGTNPVTGADTRESLGCR